jgi:phosphatidylserine/phosphatidylglycerophosphate/cardiolipin synthase-like enzyme
MLLFPATEADLVVSLLDSAQRAVLVQNGSISSAPFLESLVRARKRGAEVKVLLGAKPSYSIVSGKVLIGNRPYDLTVGKALATFSAADILVLINPRFNEIQEGVESHASYLSIDGNKSLVCTGA